MKNWRTNLLFCLMVLLTTATCSTAPVKWYRPGTSQATFSRDKADCEAMMLSTGTSQMAKDIYTIEGCLEAKGYSAIPPSSQ